MNNCNIIPRLSNLKGCLLAWSTEYANIHHQQPSRRTVVEYVGVAWKSYTASYRSQVLAMVRKNVARQLVSNEVMKYADLFDQVGWQLDAFFQFPECPAENMMPVFCLFWGDDGDCPIQCPKFLFTGREKAKFFLPTTNPLDFSDTIGARSIAGLLTLLQTLPRKNV